MENIKCIKLDNRVAENIEIRRYGEIEGGFQRDLKTEVLKKIIQSAKKGEAIPPILLAKVDGKYRLLDGQHRFEAWKQEPFELWAQINEMRPTKIVESFCTINGTSRKVKLSHQLNISTSSYASMCRKIGALFNLEPRVIHVMACELTRQKGRELLVSELQWGFIKDILRMWSNDKRWKNPNELYSSYSTLVIVTRICRNSKTPLEVLKKLQKINFSKDSPYGDRYGNGAYSHKKMIEYVSKQIVKEI